MLSIQNFSSIGWHYWLNAHTPNLSHKCSLKLHAKCQTHVKMGHLWIFCTPQKPPVGSGCALYFRFTMECA